MKAYAYKKDESMVFAGMTAEYSEESLREYCKEHVPFGCPFFLLSDEDVAAIGTTPPEAITFDESQADGIGEAE